MLKNKLKQLPSANNHIHLHLSPYWLFFPFDLYLILTGPHIRTFANAFKHPKCRILARWYSKYKCIKTLAYFLTNFIYFHKIIINDFSLFLVVDFCLFLHSFCSQLPTIYKRITNSKETVGNSVPKCFGKFSKSGVRVRCTNRNIFPPSKVRQWSQKINNELLNFVDNCCRR